MESIAGLIRQFPEGSFFIIIALIWGVESVVKAFINRHKPVAAQCNCDCCCEEDEEEEE